MAKKRAKKIYKDSDADGLLDSEEINLGTNPKKADSDNDGLNDYEEVHVYGTDPLNPDTDGDGLKDGAEVKRGRNPKGPGLLKDLFIPSHHNNFQPKSLRPKRLIFYSLSAIVFKVILVATVIVMPIEAWLTPDILLEQSKKIISLTNAIRQSLALAPLAESPLLAQAAYDKAEDMLLNQYFSHTGPDNKTLADWLKKIKYNFSVAGENLAMGFTGPEEVVNGWTRSQTHYRNMIDPEFKEIGVGMVSGLYSDIDTTFVAQYFGTPLIKPAAAEISEPVEPLVQASRGEEETVPAGESQILAEKVAEEPDLTLNQAELAEPSLVERPLIDQARSKLYIDQPEGREEKIVRVIAYLSSAAVKAQVNFNNYFIDLSPADDGEGKWTGQTIIFKEDDEQIFNPVVLATITAEDVSGSKATMDLAWDNIQPAKTTLLKQYYFIKQHRTSYLAPLFNVTSIFYKIILLIAVIALGLNIFIQVRKQHPHVIASTLGFIALLIFLIVI